jgi:hypothetical protein
VSESQAEERSLVDQVLDVVVFLPLGALLAAQSDPSGIAERGRRHLEAQVRTARFLGELAVREAGRQAQTVAADLWGGFSAARRHETSAPTAPREETEQTNRTEVTGTPPPAEGAGAPRPERPARPAPARPAPARPAPARRAATGARELAIPGYDELSAFQVVQRLGGLSSEELEAVLAYERSHRRRKTIVGRAEQLLSARADGGGGSGKA